MEDINPRPTKRRKDDSPNQIKQVFCRLAARPVNPTTNKASARFVLRSMDSAARTPCRVTLGETTEFIHTILGGVRGPVHTHLIDRLRDAAGSCAIMLARSPRPTLAYEHVANTTLAKTTLRKVVADERRNAKAHQLGRRFVYMLHALALPLFWSLPIGPDGRDASVRSTVTRLGGSILGDFHGTLGGVPEPFTIRVVRTGDTQLRSVQSGWTRSISQVPEEAIGAFETLDDLEIPRSIIGLIVQFIGYAD